MTTQPEALRLADWLDAHSNGPMDNKHNAAAELRRLHDLAMELQGKIYALEMARSMEQKTAKLKRDALLEALKLIVEFVDAPTEGKRPDVFFMRISKARAAIAKAEENT